VKEQGEVPAGVRRTSPTFRPAAALLLAALALSACAGVPESASTPTPGQAPGQATTAAPPAGSPTPPTVAPEYLGQAASLAADPRVARAFRVIEELEPRTHRDLVALTEIPAPPFAEAPRAQAYLEMLREAGTDTAWIDAEGNAIGVRRGTEGGHALILSGHLDTVFPEGTDVTVHMRGDTLFAPGVGDDTRGLVVVLTVLRALNAAEIRTVGDVWFVGTVGEEGLGDLRGVKHLFRDGGPRLDAFISIDGAGNHGVVNQALGSRRYRVTFRGPGGHSWGAFGLANPAHALGRSIQRLDREASAFTAEGPRTSYNVGVIGGGTSVNSIPFEAWMEVDMRSVDAGRLAGMDTLLHRAMQSALEEQNGERRRGEPLTLEMELVGDRPSGEIDPATPFVQRALASIRHFGWEPDLQRSSTDANVPISLGVPAVTLGGGGVGGGAHSLDEWWLNRDGHLAIQRTLLLVVAEAGLAGF
jgi:tripeptide aminopeptidase